MIQIAPSILAADFKNLSLEFEKINASGAHLIHFDVMDGVNVPNISFGFPILSAVRQLTTLPIDAHLMLQNPSRYFQQFKTAGVQHISIPIENNSNIKDNIIEIKSLGMSAGVVLDPDTSVEQILPLIHLIDMVVIMSVQPGFGGQSFIPTTFQKVRRAKEIILSENSNAKIEVDGGVSIENSAELIAMGADVLVCGSAYFKSNEYTDYVNKLIKK